LHGLVLQSAKKLFPAETQLVLLDQETFEILGIDILLGPEIHPDHVLVTRRTDEVFRKFF